MTNFEFEDGFKRISSFIFHVLDLSIKGAVAVHSSLE